MGKLNKNKKASAEIIGGILIFALFCVLILIFGMFWWNSDSYETITIKDKETKYNGGDEKYLIFTETEVYEVTDSFLLLHFSASDIYNQLDRDSTCLVHLYGWRVPFFSWYKDIVSVSNCEKINSTN